MTFEKACEFWIQRDFSFIPTALVQKAFKNCRKELKLLSSEAPVFGYPAAWGIMLHPDHSIDEIWIRENIKVVEECGILVYDSEETGILLGIDGGGYCFYTEHFKPLYKARGLDWHK